MRPWDRNDALSAAISSTKAILSLARHASGLKGTTFECANNVISASPTNESSRPLSVISAGPGNSCRTRQFWHPCARTRRVRPRIFFGKALTIDKPWFSAASADLRRATNPRSTLRPRPGRDSTDLLDSRAPWLATCMQQACAGVVFLERSTVALPTSLLVIPDVRLQRAGELLHVGLGAQDCDSSGSAEARAARRPVPPARDRGHPAVGAAAARAGARGSRASADFLESDHHRPHFRPVRTNRRRRQLQEPVRPLRRSHAHQRAGYVRQDTAGGCLARDPGAAVPVLSRSGKGFRRGHAIHGCIARVRSQEGHARLDRRGCRASRTRSCTSAPTRPPCARTRSPG